MMGGCYRISIVSVLIVCCMVIVPELSHVNITMRHNVVLLDYNRWSRNTHHAILIVNSEID